MSQWGQQPGYQYPLQTGFQGGNPQFQLQPNPQFQQQQNPQFQQQNPQFQQGFVGGLPQQQIGLPGPRQGGFQQSQQTGFPNASGFLQQQPTGFVGGNFQQQPRPSLPPPVPPIPSQFQQQSPGSSFLGVPQQQQPQVNRFLTPSPGLSGLPSQPSGFARGNGALGGPILPMMTGIIDPRLQMMSSSFMPVNVSAPYGAGGAPQLSQQPSGLSLQQSFQRHNQERGGAATPNVPWSLSKAEKKNYDAIFRAWDSQGTGYIDGRTALDVFGQSGLNKQELADIWFVNL